jgi:hypothetical protein
LRFELIVLSEGDRDRYATYVGSLRGSNLFHSLTWLEFIQKEQGAHLDLLEVRRDGRFYGYWPLLTVRKLGFRLMGSPLRGWLTSHLGPLLEGPAERELVQEMIRFCKKRGIAYLELAGKQLEEGALSGEGFTIKRRETWVLDIEADEVKQWEKLHHNCRKNIRKAERSDLEIRRLDDSRHFPRLYELVVRTFKKKRLPIPFPPRRLDLLQKTIGEHRQMLFLGAFLREEMIGGHIWGYDHHTAYALIVGHDQTHDDLRVTNKLLWEGIKRFIAMGLKKYDMYGGSRSMDGVTRFKASFGSSYESSPYFCLAMSPILRGALAVYESWYLPAMLAWRRRGDRGKAEAS